MLDHARYNVLHGLVELDQFLERVLDNLLRPLADLGAVVDRVRVENAVDHVSHQLLNLLRVELVVVLVVGHFVPNDLIKLFKIKSHVPHRQQVLHPNRPLRHTLHSSLEFGPSHSKLLHVFPGFIFDLFLTIQCTLGHLSQRVHLRLHQTQLTSHLRNLQVLCL